MYICVKNRRYAYISLFMLPNLSVLQSRGCFVARSSVSFFVISFLLKKQISQIFRLENVGDTLFGGNVLFNHQFLVLDDASVTAE